MAVDGRLLASRAALLQMQNISKHGANELILALYFVAKNTSAHVILLLPAINRKFNRKLNQECRLQHSVSREYSW